MRYCWPLVVLGMIASASGSPLPETPTEQVMTTMEAMAKATCEKDVATLDKIYRSDLTYSHSSGQTQTKAEVLKALGGATITDSMTFSNTSVRVYEDVALVKGITHILAHSPTQRYDTYLNILWVLVKGPNGWQIAARQPTQVPDPNR